MVYRFCQLFGRHGTFKGIFVLTKEEVFLVFEKLSLGGPSYKIHMDQVVRSCVSHLEG